MNRREFLAGATAFAAQAVSGGTLPSEAATLAVPRKRSPNIVVYLSDQFRWDFVGANGQNGSAHTPNLDKIAARGTNFTGAVTNQPVCAPSRSVMMTSRYATETGVWKNGPGLKEELPTLAGELRKAGYTTNYIGKWHLAPDSAKEGGGLGAVKPEHRGGFLDLWEASNVLELTSHPYEGTLYDGDGKEITYKDRYRVDFLTDRAERFLRQKHDKPFLLFISQLEPHQQNDMGGMVGPKGSAERFINASVPPDLKDQPGNWHKQLPEYYGCCESIDASVGRIRKILDEEKLADDTVFVFVSDHGCHFMTRNEEYKRSPHNSSVRVPLLIEGPGFEGPNQVSELLGLIHLAPTLLDIAGVATPKSWRGKSILPLVGSAMARAEWPNEELIQISESYNGRAIKTKDWTYCVVNQADAAASSSYHEHQLYSQRDDPSELVNLSGRKEYRQTAKELRERLKKLILASGDPEVEITLNTLYP